VANPTIVQSLSRGDARHGPLYVPLLLLTVVTGLVDAVSYLRLGHVFVANMTGNVVFLGFAAAGTPGLSALASILAIGAFALGALVGGRLCAAIANHRGYLVAFAISIKITLVAVALIVALATAGISSDARDYALIVLLGVSMGVQNAVARRAGVPDLTTTVLTMTITGLAADTKLGNGRPVAQTKRMLSVLAMLAGSGVGAALVLHVSIASALLLALALLGTTGILMYRSSSQPGAWTAPI
jgi:uncharacterized membrane protein YoaK (UPF0700 family)